mmetsp:Transcript_7344/g.8925  ORF Transcript_7344/g.8925 Transcript_7344/m.8925 type:complete len:306 (-) Transcript_7344:168-1085(-)|eukprot:jgi/Bigna1/90874/estExt_fgenesh1_pg.C_810094
MENFDTNISKALLSELEEIKSKILRAAKRDSALGQQISTEDWRRMKQINEKLEHLGSRGGSRGTLARDRKQKSPLSSAGEYLMTGDMARKTTPKPVSSGERTREQEILKHQSVGELEKLARRARPVPTIDYRPDGEYRAGSTLDGVHPIMQYTMIQDTPNVEKKLSSIASFVHNVSAPTHPHLVKGRGRMRLMRPNRNPILDEPPKRPIGKMVRDIRRRNPILDGEELNTKFTKKMMEPKIVPLEDREFKHVFTRKMVPNPFAPKRNPIMDFQQGPPPEQRRERKKIDMWFDKKKPKNLPIGMLG